MGPGFESLKVHQAEEKDASASFFHAAGFGHSRFREHSRIRKESNVVLLSFSIRKMSLLFYTEDVSSRWNF